MSHETRMKTVSIIRKLHRPNNRKAKMQIQKKAAKIHLKASSRAVLRRNRRNSDPQ